VAAFLAGCAVVAIVNAVILGAAARNRRGEHLSELTLTERELAVPEFHEDEGSGLVLTLKFASEAPQSVQRRAWRRRDDLPAVEYDWLDQAKLEALGFRIDTDRNAGDRVAFIVLELDGESWTRWLTAREERLRKSLSQGDADALLALDRTMRSRLVPIDAGLDEQALRSRYADRARYLIVEGLVRALRDADGTGTWRGRVARLSVSRIRVPRELTAAFSKFLSRETESAVLESERKERQVSWPAPAPPRYRVVVAFGRRNEPWLVSLSGLDAN
jgi:hypothetical protein